MYKENPKTKGSGIICCIPHEGVCPIDCADCFFQSGRSYLEPLNENLPNMPTLEEVGHRVVRVNDGNDSNNEQSMVIRKTEHYPLRFYNTSMSINLERFKAPVVLTVNPGKRTDENPTLLKSVPSNLMFVRVRVNLWNLTLVQQVIAHYRQLSIPIVLTFMAYHDEPALRSCKKYYTKRKRTLNTYYAITQKAWYYVMEQFAFNAVDVYSCGKVEGKSNGVCKSCGNCLREFYRTLERMDK